jgi:hypothetical protein
MRVPYVIFCGAKIGIFFILYFVDGLLSLPLQNIKKHGDCKKFYPDRLDPFSHIHRRNDVYVVIRVGVVLGSLAVCIDVFRQGGKGDMT